MISMRKNLSPYYRIFLQDYNAVNIIHENTGYKSVNNPSCINLIITNSRNSFQSMSRFCTGLSDFRNVKDIFHKSCIYTNLLQKL